MSDPEFVPWLSLWWYFWSCSGRLVVVMVVLLVVEVFLTVRTLRMTIIRPVEQPDYLWPRCRGIFSRLSRLRFSASDILLGQWQCQCGSEINFHFDGLIKNLKRAACPMPIMVHNDINYLCCSSLRFPSTSTPTYKEINYIVNYT